MSDVTFEEYASSRGWQLTRPVDAHVVALVWHLGNGALFGKFIPNDHPDECVWERLLDDGDAARREYEAAA